MDVDEISGQMSSISHTIQTLREESKSKCQEIYHQMFRKVKGQLEHEVSLKERKGLHQSTLRLPNVRSSLSIYNINTLPPQVEIDRYIINQLEKRGISVIQSTDHSIDVDWSGIYKQDKKIKPFTKSQKSFPDNKQCKATIAHEKSSGSTMTASLPPPPMNIKSSKPTHSKKPDKSKKKSTSIEPKRPVLSNNVPVLDSHTEQKMAAAHQALLRCLAGV